MKRRILAINLDKFEVLSVNHKFTFNKRIGTFILTPKYRDFKNLLLNACLKNMALMPPYSIEIDISCFADIDNAIKPILDTLKKAGVINDDRQVVRLIVNKEHIKRGISGYLRVRVEEV